MTDTPRAEAPASQTAATTARAPVFEALGVTKVYHMGEVDVHALRGVAGHRGGAFGRFVVRVRVDEHRRQRHGAQIRCRPPLVACARG